MTRKFFTAVVAAFLFVVPAVAAAQVSLNHVKIGEAGPWTLVQVDFNVLLRYVTHNPQRRGDDLRIEVQLVNALPGRTPEIAYSRQTVQAPPDNPVDLVDVVYEGDVAHGPYVTLFFKHTVAFKVQQGSDFRSLVVVVLPTTGVTEGEAKVTQLDPESAEIELSHKVEDGFLREKTLELSYNVASPDLLKGLKLDDAVKFRYDAAQNKIVGIEPLRQE